MLAADSYEWRTAPCSECADPAARLAPGDSDRADILLCTRCPAHGRFPYRDPAHIRDRDPAHIRARLPFGVALAMRDGALCIGTPAAPHGLNAYTRSVVALATEHGLLAVWRPSTRRHHMTLAAPDPEGAWGWMEVGASSGRILRATVHPHGRSAPGIRAAGPRAVRQLVACLSASGQSVGPEAAVRDVAVRR
ncbi:hypothetical protein ACFRSX_32575 [Streptomyces goshikiensis]|uniref:hypothetical protein n=1 Tax=Streptomyces TaxID=1883 RepID=UPI000C2808F6|nr:hypothetical protein [Streptomyces sp. CB02120-2]PJN14521.1 hypothetical protein CG724_33040 [Streptomyces sp. CB02120-2]